MDDIFRSFFGFTNKPRIFDDDPRIHLDDDNAADRSSIIPNDDGERAEHFPFDGDRSFTILHPGDIFAHFDQMFASFDKIFSGVRVEEMPSIDVPMGDGTDDPSMRPPNNRRSLRDRMLKEPERNEADSFQDRRTDHIEERNTAPSFFGRFLPTQVEKKGDTDMDDAVKSQGIDRLFNDARPLEVVPAPRTRSAYKSVSVQTRRMPDGKVEERRTTVDSAGNQETLVTRSMDGQTYQQTVRKNKLGEEEVAENFSNMSEHEKSDFEKKWNTPSESTRSPTVPFYSSPQSDLLIHDRETATIFERLFGFDFPRYGSR